MSGCFHQQGDQVGEGEGKGDLPGGETPVYLTIGNPTELLSRRETLLTTYLGWWHTLLGGVSNVVHVARSYSTVYVDL